MPTRDDFFGAWGPGDVGFVTDDLAGDGTSGTPIFRMGVFGVGSAAGVFGRGGFAEAPRRNAFVQSAGVIGTARDMGGVAGSSVSSAGVYGQTEIQGEVPNLLAGVYGTGNFRPGVAGWSNHGPGALGTSFLGIGVRGTSSLSAGIQGQSADRSGVVGVSGASGPAIPNFTNIAGVHGTSDALHGVIGTSNQGVGVFGFSNNFGVVGQTTNSNSFAGFFNGNVLVVNGALTATVKNAVVPFPDGTQRLLHCVESPEHWFEDFGTAKLRNGRAVVKLDADFAKVIKRGDYRVFITPEGDCGGLYVRGKGASSFEVRELAGGKSSVAFAYRIVGRRKDIKAHQRFAKIDTRPPPPAPTTAVSRKRKRTASERRAFVARLEKETGGQNPKRKGKRLRAARPPMARQRTRMPAAGS